MRYIVVMVLSFMSMASCAQSTKQNLLFEVCDTQKNDEREELGEQLFSEGNINELIRLTLPCANAGDSFYQFSLASIYYSENAMQLVDQKVDFNLSFKWFKKAAEQGYEDAILFLLDAYESGEMGVKRNKKPI
jgi:TPR repeat protein